MTDEQLNKLTRLVRWMLVKGISSLTLSNLTHAFRDAVRLCMNDYWEECVSHGPTDIDEDPRLAHLGKLRAWVDQRAVSATYHADYPMARAFRKVEDEIDAMVEKLKGD